MSLLSDLNDRQREAAETLSVPLLIIAGAGSGKTRALTYRIAHLIQQGMAQPWQILAVTFTNKAAGEMQRRVEELLTQNFDLNEKNRPMIGTFHSVCVRILRKYIERLGREKSFVIYDATDQQSLMKRLIKENQIDDEKIKYQVVLGMISKFKNQLKGAADFLAKAGNHFERQVATLFSAYEKRLKDNNALDFDDLLLYTVKLFQENPDVLDEYQERWRYISIDEYQDTNHAQYTLAKLWAAKYRNICVIGDSDQSIYSFRGADITNILEFEKDYPDAKVIKLEQNYRSTQVILDAADSVIAKNKRRKAKKMWTEKEGGDLIEVIHARSETEEADWVAREIEKLMRLKEVSLKDIVVLYRTNAQSRILEEAFLRHGLPYKVIGGVKFYARKEIKDILAYLRVIHNPNDTDSLLRIINTPSRRIGQGTIHKLQAFGLERSLSLAEVLNHIQMVDEVKGATKEALVSFWQMIINFQKRAQDLHVSEFLRQIVKQIDFKKHLTEDGTEEGEMRYENVMELISVATKYDETEPELSLAYFLEEVSLVADTDQITDDISNVTLMTLHSVKGLEYPYVFIVGCEENIFPHSRALFEEAGMEEERRLMYVGVTRAMHKLYLLAAKQRMLYGDYQSNPLSRFIDDIPKELMEATGLEPMDRSELFFDIRKEPVKEKHDPEIAEKKFKDGDKVTHASFGEGIVVERRGDLVTVAFKDKVYGIKKFAANIAPLEKLSQ
ncbi:UvrD-helicase domain-containing protein [Patescibacteria group bacterium]|nr:UvrD-helicase domain-containing protein [Patescibacteria group bacterium]MBU1015644.1 UvrD-helicase domain-containing protein [Patescibacteria group bacterium]MBU1684781.1 UvrD-helicase domain-containing protein [Patescibacteria group bacterium]MBU1938215.1 UvrD-helicase domain-containing protein [Patescibacteria group bacterium]